MFNLDTLAHDNLKAGHTSLLGCLVVGNAQLHPDHPGTNLYGIIHNRRNRLRPSEYVYDVYRERDRL